MANYPVTSEFDSSGNPPALTPGDYVVTLTEVKDRNKEGKPYVDKNGDQYELFIFDVENTPNSVVDSFYFGTNRKNYAMDMGKLKQLLEAGGRDTNKPGDTQFLVGLRCIATLKTNEYQGVVRNRVVAYKVADPDAVPPPSDDNAPKF